MRRGLASLREETGQDYGYDVAAWHEYLTLYSDEHDYTHPFEFDGVQEAVAEAIKDPDWPRFVRLAQGDAKPCAAAAPHR